MLGAFAKLGVATVTVVIIFLLFIISFLNRVRHICLHDRMEQLASHRTDFYEI